MKSRDGLHLIHAVRAEPGGTYYFRTSRRGLERTTEAEGRALVELSTPPDVRLEWRVPGQRCQLLPVAVGFAACSVPSCDRALSALRTWLDAWAGIGREKLTMDLAGKTLLIRLDSAAAAVLVRESHR